MVRYNIYLKQSLESRASIIEAVKEQPELHDTGLHIYLTHNTRSYVAMGSGIHMTDAGFKVEVGVGVHQGAVPSGYLYSLGQNIVQCKIIVRV